MYEENNNLKIAKTEFRIFVNELRYSEDIGQKIRQVIGDEMPLNEALKDFYHLTKLTQAGDSFSLAMGFAEALLKNGVHPWIAVTSAKLDKDQAYFIAYSWNNEFSEDHPEMYLCDPTNCVINGDTDFNSCEKYANILATDVLEVGIMDDLTNFSKFMSLADFEEEIRNFIF